MPIVVLELPGGVTRVVLAGRIDMAGAHAIDPALGQVGASHGAVVIDLGAVEFLASMGLRSLMICAKSIFSRHGRVVLLAPRPAVAEVLAMSGIDALIPIHAEAAAAIAAVRPA